MKISQPSQSVWCYTVNPTRIFKCGIYRGVVMASSVPPQHGHAGHIYNTAITNGCAVDNDTPIKSNQANTQLWS